MPDIICPNTNCNYQGPANHKKSGSVLVFLLLLVIGILPGHLVLDICPEELSLLPKMRPDD